MYANILPRNQKSWRKRVIFHKEKKAKHWNDEHSQRTSTTKDMCIQRSFYQRAFLLQPVHLIEFRVILRVTVLHSDAARQDGGNVVFDAFVLSFLFTLLFYFA